MTPSKQPARKPRAKTYLFSFGFFNKDREYVLENLALLLSSGMDVLAAFQAIKQDVRSAKMQQLISQVETKISAGSSLWRALEETKLLPGYMLSLLKIGEASGRLSKNLKVMVLQQQKDREFRSKIRSAMLYPSVVFGLTAIIGLGVSWFILPRLAEVFNQLHQDLPLLTTVFIDLGIFLKAYGYVVVPSLIFIVLLVWYVLFANAKTKHLGQEFLFHFPGIKKLIQEVEISRFGFILGTLLESGLPVVEAINSLQQTSSLKAYQRFYTYLQKSIEQGNSFHASFSNYPKSRKLIPIPFQQLIVSGEQSGNLAAALIYVGKTFDEKVETSSKNLAVILEPILLVVVWLGVIAVAVAVILPIYNMLGNINP
ncbi:type II secretion system F family protein [Candidatus Parcubacteria bacterium]|jgi:type II secretory pathway component PulF|nr:MAG: type II secretion system F family protein [Candidatus Parcubacteria bacterium]